MSSLDESGQAGRATNASPFEVPSLLPAAVGICTGIAIDDAVMPAAWTWVALGLGAAAIMFAGRFARRRAAAVLALLGAALGGASHLAHVRRVPPNHIVHASSPEPMLVRVTGRVASEPIVSAGSRAPFAAWSHATARTTFVLRSESLATNDGPRPVRGHLRITVREPLLWPRMGDRVELVGRLYRPPPPSNPGEFDWARWNARSGLHVGLSCENALCVRPSGDDVAGGAIRWWGRLRAHVRGLLLDSAVASHSPDASLLEALILGQRAGVDPELDQAFVRAGCAHFLAASGFNVGILASVIWGIARVFKRTRRACAAWAIAAIIVYVLAADPRPPILRAGVMTVAVSAALAVRRSVSPLAGLILSAALILVFQPGALFDAGFQLSFAAVLALFVLTPPIADGIRFGLLRERPHDPLDPRPVQQQPLSHRAARAVRAAVAYGAAAPLAAWLGTLPITLVHFQQFSPWGPFNSLILTLLVSVVTTVGYGKVSLTLLIPTVGDWLGRPLDAMTVILARLVRALAELPATVVSCPSPPTWLTLVYFLTLAALAARYHGRCGKHTVWVSAAALAAGIAAWLGWPKSSDRLAVTVFSVGRASATVIEMPDGRAWLYDCGSERGDVGESLVAPYLLSRRHARLDAVIISHPNLDHFSGAPAAIDRLGCRRVLLSSHFARLAPPGSPAERLLELFSGRSISVDTIASPDHLGGSTDVQCDVLWPPPDQPFELSANDASLVIRVRYAGFSILFTGDIEEAAQRWLIEHADLRADVLLSPHHGAVEPSTKAFVAAVDPRWIVQSADRSDPNTHSKLGSIIGQRVLLNTGDVGAVTISIDLAGLRVTPFRDGVSP